jgi:polysaccharide biosynthesis transport protein
VPDLGKLPGAGRGDAQRAEPIDYLFNDPRSPFNAAFRSIHASLRLGSGAQAPRSVAVSSALPEEGKTTVSICLARSAALAGLRVVLVDCDGRRPAASRALAAHVTSGLVEVLEGSIAARQAMLRDTPSGAWVLAHSSDRPASNDLIGSDAMAALIAQLTRDFDLVVLDTAPALALAEARGVAAMADKVILVARWRSTPIQATRIALDMLRQSGSQVAGIALTLVGR